MKEAGRSSIGATRPIGSVATIGRIGSPEGAARFSASSITSKPLGRTIESTRAFGAKDHVFSAPSQERNPSEKINIGKLEPYNFLGSVPTNNRLANGITIENRTDSPLISSQQTEKGRHNHRRRPGRISRAHGETPRSIIRTHEIRENAPVNKVEFPNFRRPRISEPIMHGDAVRNREIITETQEVQVPKKINVPESHAWKSKLLKKTNSKASLIEIKNTQPIARKKIVAENSLAGMYIKPRRTDFGEIPETRKLRFANVHSLNRQETTTNTAMKIDEETAQEKKTITSVPKLLRVSALPDADLELEEETRLKAALAVDVKTQKNSNTDRKQKLKEVILNAFRKNKTTDNKDPNQNEDEEVKYGVDKPTDNLRHLVISTLRTIVVNKSIDENVEPSWNDVAYLFNKNHDKSLKSELVQKLQYEDNTLVEVTQSLARAGTIYPMQNPVKSIILKHPAVTLPRKQVAEEVPLSYVRSAIGEMISDQAA